MNDDELYGNGGSDKLYGEDGNDILDGGDISENYVTDIASINKEVDELTGGNGADTFVLGRRGVLFAENVYNKSLGNNDYALIHDFKQNEGDKIQLVGSAKDYVTDKPPQELGISGTAIYRIAPQVADVFFIEDASESFAGYRSIFKACATDLVSKLKASNPDSMFGLGSFDDYPVSPFGLIEHTEYVLEQETESVLVGVGGGYINNYGQEYYTNYRGERLSVRENGTLIEENHPGDGSGYGTYYVPDLTLIYEERIVREFRRPVVTDEGSAYVYQTNQSLNIDANLTLSAFDSGSTQTQADSAEAQLEALFRVANDSNSIGFRSDAARLVVLATDAPYHIAGDGLAAGKSVDYPTISTLKTALTNAKIVPIFAVTDNVASTYQDLVSQLGFGAVVGLSSDSKSLSDAITGNLSSNSSNRDLIGIVQNVSSLELNANYFTYV